jgi:hypothetical protein
LLSQYPTGGAVPLILEHSVIQLLIDFLNGFTLGLDPEKVIDNARHQEPAAELEEGGRYLRQRYVGFDEIAGADDQREPHRADAGGAASLMNFV